MKSACGPYILAIETSCDDTSVSLVNQEGYVLCQVTASQDLKHQIFGGVVPEIASRLHAEVLLPLIDTTLKNKNISPQDLKAIAVTNRPGLIGSLIVGVVTAKTLGQVWGLPVYGINHLEGHILAPLLWDDLHEKNELPPFNWLTLAVSGGHTSLYLVHSLAKYQLLGSTRDDAAGEVFDKFAKILNLGFPGGALVDQAAQRGAKGRYEFPVTKLDGYDFSFSGLKSAADRLVRQIPNLEFENNINNLCADFQSAVIENLFYQLKKAYQDYHPQVVMLTGGVSANSELRVTVKNWAQSKKIPFYMPALKYCTDNSAMIALAAWKKIELGVAPQNASLIAQPNSEVGDFI